MQTVAHELGHNLNMQHDFINPFSNPKTDRFHPDGTKCTDDNGIMDYFVVRIMLLFCYSFNNISLNILIDIGINKMD